MKAVYVLDVKEEKLIYHEIMNDTYFEKLMHLVYSLMYEKLPNSMSMY